MRHDGPHDGLDVVNGFYRLTDIIGNPKANPPIPGIFPVSRSAWYEGVKSGYYPRQYQLSDRSVGWLKIDVHELIIRIIGSQNKDSS